MSIINKEILLADYLDGKISESELLSKHPELSEDVELIKVSTNALKKLEFLQPIRKFNTKAIRKKIEINPTFWYAAASIILIIGLSILFKNFNFSTIDKFDNDISSNEIDIKLLGIWSIWQSSDIQKNEREKLLDIAINNENSTVRYLAIQKLIDQPLKLDEDDLYLYINKELNFNNQTAWIELWQKQYSGKSEMFTSWLEKDYVNPIVKEYAEESIRNF